MAVVVCVHGPCAFTDAWVYAASISVEDCVCNNNTWLDTEPELGECVVCRNSTSPRGASTLVCTSMIYIMMICIGYRSRTLGWLDMRYTTRQDV